MSSPRAPRTTRVYYLPLYDVERGVFTVIAYAVATDEERERFAKLNDVTESYFRHETDGRVARAGRRLTIANRYGVILLRMTTYDAVARDLLALELESAHNECDKAIVVFVEVTTKGRANAADRIRAAIATNNMYFGAHTPAPQ